MAEKTEVTFWNGKRMPLVGFGTRKLPVPATNIKFGINLALEIGYRLIDTAYTYENEDAIGDVLRDWIESGKIKREEIFVTTKLPPFANIPEKVEVFLQKSLNSLKLDYVDLYLIHFPVGLTPTADDEKNLSSLANGQSPLDMNTNLEALWKAMEAQVDAGRVKSIGLANFNSEQIERIVISADIKPAILQVELNLYSQQKLLKAVCDKHGIKVCACRPLESWGGIELSFQRGLPFQPTSRVLHDPDVHKIARNHSRTPSQILLRHLIQQDIVVIPRCYSEILIRENFDVFNFVLSTEELEKLDSMDKNCRSFEFEIRMPGAKKHKEWPFKIPF